SGVNPPGVIPLGRWLFWQSPGFSWRAFSPPPRGGGVTARDPGLRALLLGVASGALFGLAAAVTAYVTDLFDNGLGHVLGAWQTWALIAAGVVGVYLQQRAYQVGPLTASLPAVTIAEPLAAAFIGFAVLEERLQTGAGGLVVVVAAVLVMCATAVSLSRSQAAA
ncbi:DMT family transporter, partial [Nocardia abscessus]|uniref:DMT family transporter n=1 Tax=Nocardia abscessus TaxID=120957 RepID=UPI0024577EA0